MKARPFRLMTPFVAAAFASSVLFTTPVQANLIGTDQVAAPAQSERDRVKAALERPDVVKKLEMFGVMAEDAKSRVDALTDAEVASLAGTIDMLPAGGLTTTEWILIGVVILIVLVLAL